MASGWTNNPNPTQNSMGFGGWKKVDSSNTIASTVKVIAIMNNTEAAATVTFTSHDYGSTNTTTTTSEDIGAGTVLPGLFTNVSCSSGSVLVAFQVGEMPA